MRKNLEPERDREDQLRRILFVPANTKKRLHSWIKLFLQIDLPDSIVDPGSNCTPMDMVWEAYNKMRLNDDPEFKRVLYYACREGGKTIAESVIEVLCMVHLDRDVIHLAAIEAQSRKSIDYAKNFLNKPYLREFIVGDNARELAILRYHHAETGEDLTQKEFERLPMEAQAPYERIAHYVRIIVATIASANGQHAPVLCLDEIDVLRDRRAYAEAQLIPSSQKGMRPVTILTSTRKVSYGLVQEEIDNQDRTKLLVRKWNIIDVTEKCKPERHRPDLPKLTVYRDDANLKHISEDVYAELSVDQKAKYDKDEDVFGGCATCELYPMCQGRLATKQTLVKSPISFLKDIDDVIGAFRAVSVPMAQAQLLCRKPSTEGLIYPQLIKEVHLISAAEMAQKITGTTHPANMTKAQLLKLIESRKMRWTAGLDWGFTHDFAVAAGPVDGVRKFYVECISKPGLQPDQKLRECEEVLRRWDPDIYADPSEPDMVAMFRSRGWKMKKWDKGEIAGGIELVRIKIRPSIGEPQLFFLKGDPMCEYAFKLMAQYHWDTDKNGNQLDKPAKEDDDLCDGVRYDIVNVFPSKGRGFKAQMNQSANDNPLPVANEQKWFRQIVEEATGTDPHQQANDNGTPIKGKKNGFGFDFS